jgi:hypothetical protein
LLAAQGAVMTPRQIAIDLIRKYVERGDSYDQIRGHMGSHNDRYSAEVHLDKIRVMRIGGYTNGQEVNVTFKLRDIYDEITSGQQEMF